MCTDDADAQPEGFNYDESKVPSYTLPDPLVALDGSAVDSTDSWRRRRREVYGLFSEHVFGSMPPRPESVGIKVASEGDALGGRAMRRQVVLTPGGDPNGPHWTLLIYLPKAATSPVPAFLGYNFEGNHTVHAEEGILLGKLYGRDRPNEGQPADASSRGSKASRWDIEAIVERGYALATMYYGDVDPDFHDEFQNGVHALYPEYQDRDDNWSSIGGWAWGLSRVLDYFETQSDVDARRVAVIGHSRTRQDGALGPARATNALPS